jgi:hypothetical protein
MSEICMLAESSVLFGGSMPDEYKQRLAVSEFVVHTHLQARKDPTQRSLEARLRNARYLAELTKFRLAPFGTFFLLLKSLLDDFVGHNVDAAAALVETAGRFLYRLPETQTRISNMLEVCEAFCH